ncbi:transglycosylase domain-containing protein [Microbacterium sp. STN6]|uniref:transglycosylase domain-containing protein n=1 Tax=Microbacterium sp. STN6 TaxID=2995588 RepID=UPI002260A1C7|nr:transglycosylase domain-containing protein [Microbacterium sp. STN6]MCX7520920.1 transglycosylase domain-containing protein [Microbacterium sp. STN6]
MSAQKPTTRGALSAFAGFVGMSVVAGLLVTAAVTPAIAVTGMAANDTIGVFEGLPEYLKLDDLPQVTSVYAKSGDTEVQIASFYAQNRVAVKWDQVSDFAKDAATSGEDPRFYQHGGVDIKGTIRGALSTWIKGDTQGGSTITQQYVKNVLIQKCEVYNVEGKANQKKYHNCYNDATETTPDRKLKEMKMAIGLEKKYSKKQILLGYLNIAGFGGKVYGIESAARYYYGVSAKDLSLPQAASLLAIVNNPSYYKLDDPESKQNGAANGYAANKSRRDYIIDRMLQYKKITQQQHDEAIKAPIEPHITPPTNGCMAAAQYNAATFCDYVQHVIEHDKAFGKTEDARYAALLRGGFKIYTTLDLGLQKTAQDSLSAYIPSIKDGMDLGAANVAVEQNTGRIITMVQNRPFNNTGNPPAGSTALNYAVDFAYGGASGAQTGSTWKAFDLAAWLQEGHSLYESIDATRHRFPQSMFHSSCSTPSGPDWSVSNDEGVASRINVLNATKYSVNTAFAMMGTKIDLCGIKKAATALGVHLAKPNSDGSAALAENPSSMLGTQSISPLTMATAYAGFANNGKICTPVAIDKIINSDGTERPVTPTTCKQAIDPKVAAGVAYALETPLQGGGTAATANPRDGVPMLAKTGTTDHAYDNWLVTSTTKVSTATWIGNANSVLKNGKWVKADMHRVYFRGPGGNYAGNNAKFPVAKVILAAINKQYGGDAFTPVENTMLYGVQIGVPDLTGKSPTEAKSILEGVGFIYVDGGETDGVQAAGTVERTDPAAGSNASKGSSITVYTSKQNKAKLPDAGQVVGKSLKDATSALSGFTVKTTGGSGDPTDIVTAMSPDGGSVVDPGSTVTLTLKKADASTQPPAAPGSGG